MTRYSPKTLIPAGTALPATLLEPSLAMACDGCGTVVRWRDLGEMAVRTLGPVRHLPPHRCEEAEYEIRCTHCGLVDGYQPALLCAVCGARPCECNDEPQS